jgi:signal transduction histidine kinase/DNA-binding response OmpR family regulator
LYRYKDGQFTNINSSHGLSFDRLFSILEDDQHNLWFSGNRGIFRTSKQQLNDCADDKVDTITCQSFNHLDGMRETECNGRRQPVAWKSRDGRLWFVSTAGVVSVDPNNMVKNDSIPPVYIEEITANQQRTISPDSAVIPLEAQERELEIRYTALSFAIPERVYFKYKLEGYDQDWIDAGTRRTAFYTNIPKGDYTFRVIACNNDGKWNEQGASVQFSIAPFWWETWWAYSLYVLAFGVLLYGLRRYEMKRIRFRNELKLEHVRSERLQELDHLKSRFFAGISHEFRTPLTLIGGPLHDMLEKSRDDQEKPQIEMMLRNTQRLQRLVDQLLDLAQLESGKMTLQARPVLLLPFLQGLIAAFESHAHQKNIRLTLNVDESLNGEMVYLDADKMEKVIINLVANALKYTASGGAVEVAVRKAEGLERKAEGEEQSARLLAISVRDTGSGIPAHILPHIFDYFYRYQQKDNRQETGSGIGLALAKELVELHHGTISVISQEGAGSEFTITLPLGKAHLKPEEIAGDTLTEEFAALRAPLLPEAPVGDDDQEQQTGNDGQKKPSAKILLVEDNADMRRYLREHLQAQWQLLEATDGEAGLQQALAEIPDLIISDVMMPKMDGFELCRKLKTNELTSHIPLILLTARGSGESKLEGLELGADEYLTKPLVARELRLRVRNLIEQQRKLRRRISQEIATPEVKLSSLKISSADERFLQRATAVLEAHLDDPDFDPEALAAALAISRVHLNRKLRGLLGLRTSDFIRNLRLKRAAELLRAKSGTVSEIAYQIGFNHLSYFARCFKEQYGKLPSEYAQD